jgi:hypothetical protein
VATANEAVDPDGIGFATGSTDTALDDDGGSFPASHPATATTAIAAANPTVRV